MITETCIKLIEDFFFSGNTRDLWRKYSNRTIVKPERQTSISKNRYSVANV